MRITRSLPRLAFGTVKVEDRVRSIKDPLKPRHFVQQFERVLPAHAPVIHTILVQGSDARIQKPLRHFLDALEDFRWRFIFIVAWFKAHDAHVAGTYVASPLQ